MRVFIKNSIIVLTLITLDQLLKFFFQSKKPFINLGLVVLHFVTNTGASFGMLQGNNVALAWVSVIVLGIIMMNADKIRKEQTVPVLLIVSGIIGNLIDRVFRGFVVDFIDFKFWPVFNLADSLIVIGVVWLIIVILVKDLKKENIEKPRRHVRRK